jgi:hypothetical protein
MKTFKRIMILFYLSGLLFSSCAVESQPRKIATLHEVTDPHNRMWATKNRLFATHSTDPLQMRSESMWYPYSIQNMHLYQLILNEQTDKWELYSVKII